ncbi:MAG: LCP family protein [Microthrixaceae bacterium]|nr:LCP family protein [Microthrixaceae bacterium]MCO5317588.1 LCP family protein [Microthrixaceae bacterium]
MTPLRVALGVLGVVLVGALGFAGYTWWQYQSVERVDVELAEVAHGAPRNYLVVGSDSRSEIDPDDPGADAFLGDDAPGGQRSDSIAILRVAPEEERIDVLSIPRDLWVTLPDGSESRINAAYAESTQTLIDTIQENLDIPIHHFAEVDFVGFKGLIDSLGGVPMYFDSPVRDQNSGLSVPEAGCVVLDGDQGLAFARSRHLSWKDADGWHTDPTGDLGRMTRQQLLMRASVAKANTMGLDDIPRLKGLVDSVLDSATVDTGLGFGDILGLGQRFSGLDPQRLQTHSLVVEGDRTSGGASILRLDRDASFLTLAFFKGEAPPAEVTTTTTPAPEPDDLNVSVFNGGAGDGEARRVSYVLTDGGFGIGYVETAPEDQDRTSVSYGPGAGMMGELVAAWLGPDPELLEDDSLDPGQVVVVLGADFEHVGEPEEDPLADGSAGDAASGTADGSGTATTGSSQPGTTTTTTTVPGWTPGVPPEGVECV